MSKSQLVHIIQQYHLIEGHCHLDLLNCKYGKRVEQLTYPSQYVGCITNFAFPQYFVNLDYLCTPENVWSTLRLRPKYAQTLDQGKAFIVQRARGEDIVVIGEAGLDSKTDTHE